MYKYLHPYNKQAGYSTLLLLQPQHDHYLGELVISDKNYLDDMLYENQVIWTGWIKDVYVNNAERVFKYYYYKDDPEQHRGIDFIQPPKKEHSIKYYLNTNPRIEVVGYIVLLDNDHKLKYQEYSFLD